MRHIILDSSPLGLLSNRARSNEVIAISKWARSILAGGDKIYVPEVIDYEIRRELLRASKAAGLVNLNQLRATCRYVPISTEAMSVATELWAGSRNAGQPTGDPKKLDIDVIMVAQALTLGAPRDSIVVATENVKHISRFIAADLWMNIR